MKIQPIVASQEIPAVRNIRVPLGAFTGQAEGFRALGAGLGQMSEDWYHVARYEQAIEKKKKEFDRVTKTLELTSELKGRVDDVHREIEKFPSADNAKILKHFERQRNLVSSEMRTKALQSGSDVYDLFNRESLAIWTNAEIKTKEIRDLKWKDEKVAELDSIQNRLEEDAAKMLVGGKDPRPAIEFYDALVQKARNEGIISSVNLEKRRETLSDRINANLKTLQAEMVRQEEKTRETAVYTLLKMEFGTNYDKMLEKLQDPDFLKSQDLTLEKSANLANIIQQQKIRDEQLKKARQDETATQFSVLLRENRLTKDLIKSTIEAGSLDYRVGDAFDKALDTQVKDPDGKIKTDKGTYAMLLSLAWTHPDREYVKKEILKNAHRLDDPDFERLLSTNESKADARLRESINVSKKLIENTVIPKRGQMASYLSTPKEEDDLANALTAFNDAIQTAKKKNPNLQSEDIKKLADQIKNDYSKSLSERLMEFTTYTTEQLKKDTQKIKEKTKKVEMTDAQISEWLTQNAYLADDENIATFKKQNGIK